MAPANANYPWPSTVNVANFVSVMPRLQDHEERSKYKIWKKQMLCLLESQGLLGFIDGEMLPPDHDEHNKLWRRTDKLVTGWILGSVGEDALAAVVTLNTAMDVWLELKKIFGQEEEDIDNAGEVQEIQMKSSEDGHDPHKEDATAKDFSCCLPLYRAAVKGDWKMAEEFFNKDSEATKAIISSRSETALHVAVLTGEANDFVKKLLELMPDDALALKNSDGDTALHCAAIVGNKEAAIMLVNRKYDLQYIPNNEDRLPVHEAAVFSHKDTLLYLISMWKPNEEDSPLVGKLGIRLLVCVIASEFLDVALDLVQKYPDLAKLKDGDDDSALEVLAKKESVFLSGESFSWWQSFIYSYILLKSSTLRFDHTTSIAHDTENQSLNSPVYRMSSWFQISCGLSQKLDATLWKVMEYLVPQVKAMAHKKLMHEQARQLVECLCRNCESSNICESSIILAAKHGIHEVVEAIIELFPQSIFAPDSETDSYIFHLAVKGRFENIFNLIYRMNDLKHYFSDSIDNLDNNFMHLCAKLAPPHKLNLVSGAALQMQRELQWFKEMEKFISPSRRLWPNNVNKTPKMIFTEEHQQLKAEGERWMKDTANSCTIAAALIATVVFAAAFTVPGGIAVETGYPIFRDRFAFTLFALSDAISLFMSITSLLMFLSILTSRYAEEDFLYVLPKRLSIGLLTLFISIISMMVAFSATLYLVVVKQDQWLLTLVGVALACLPVASFMRLQFPLLLDVICSTYGSGIFGKKNNRPLY